jgi:putative oxidoreductase
MIKKYLMMARTQQTQAEASADVILRVFAGLTLALAHGFGKLPPSSQFIDAVRALGFPMPSFFAWCAGGAEFLGGLLLAFGLCTRPAAGAIAFTMMTAGFMQHASDSFHVKELALIYLAISLFYLLSGAGQYSLDAVIGTMKSRKKSKKR